MDIDYVVVGERYRITANDPRRADVFVGDIVRVRHICGNGRDIGVDFISGRGRKYLDGDHTQDCCDVNFDWFIYAEHVEPIESAGAVEPTTVDTFALLGRTQRGGF